MDGIINIYKEKGWTSFDVTKKLRSILHEKKVGHTGTLDPEAEGVLVVCAGKATKLVEAITGTDKEYEAELRLGIITDTEDTTGTVLETRPVQVTEEEIRRVIRSFIGEQEQIPPMYSAKKLDGRKLYELARAGIEVERKPCRITISDIRIDEIAIPHVRMTVVCSKGTYIRTLCRDIGEKLGCGAAMSALRRTRVGSFRIENSKTLEELERLAGVDAAQTPGVQDLYAVMRPAIYVPGDAVVAFGKFDGCHRGHQKIFDTVFRLAKESGRKTAVMTFSEPPEAVITGIHKPVLSTSPELETRLRNLGFDYVFTFPMTPRTMLVSREDFLKDILVDAMHAKAIVAGTDCSFGYKAKGDAAFLKEQESVYGFTAHVIEKSVVKDEAGCEHEISSTYIKSLLSEGNVRFAGELLGRYYSFSGKVVHGRHIGTERLAFPTANLIPTPGKLIPRDGVYITRVLIGDTLYKGMTNIGTNPTVATSGEVRIETHILDFHEELYDRKIRVEFAERIRDQRKFESLQALQEQLKKDVETVRAFPLVLEMM